MDANRLTDAFIRKFRDAALRHGDDEAARICDKALDTNLSEKDRAKARKRVAEMQDAADAMDDSDEALSGRIQGALELLGEISARRVPASKAEDEDEDLAENPDCVMFGCEPGGPFNTCKRCGGEMDDEGMDASKDPVDTNGDGEVTPEEYLGALGEDFKEVEGATGAPMFRIGDDPALYSLEEVTEANAEHPEVVAEIAALLPGESATIGGGAAAEFKVTRVEEVPEVEGAASEAPEGLDDLIANLDEMTDRNAHTDAVVALARWFGDKGLLKEAQKIAREHAAKGHMPYKLSQTRRALLKALRDGVAAKYGQEVADKVWAAF